MRWPLVHRGILFLWIILIFKGSSVDGSECSPNERRTNLNGCLTKIRERMLDPDIFWFGNSFSERCRGSYDPILCLSNTEPSLTSIETRLFKSNDAMASLDRFVELEFRSPGKNYNACGNHFVTNEDWSWDVDPLSDTIVYPWYARNLPFNISWTYQPGDLFTMIIYDVGYYISHGVYINIQGSDLNTAEVISHYHGPLITTDYHNPYIFLLFKQSGPIQLSDKWRNKFIGQSNDYIQRWDFEEMMTDLQLQGPVGANFITSTGDEYAAQSMQNQKFLAMCPVYTSRALRQETRPFIPPNVQLSVWIDFVFTNEQLDFSVCCKDYKYSTRNFSLNPLGNPIYATADVRTSNPHSLSFRKLGFYASSQNFTGNTYTLVAFDPDVPRSNVGTESRPLLHGMVTDIVNGDIKTGDFGLHYQGPFPPDLNSPHTYYTFLYEQQAGSSLNATDLMHTYDGDCAGSLAGRCLFDINRMASENNLTLVGATWFRSVRDAYVIQRNVERGAAMETECQGHLDYPLSCDTSAAPITMASLLSVTVTALILCIKGAFTF